MSATAESFVAQGAESSRKDAEQIGSVDPLIVGRAAVIFERGGHTPTLDGVKK
ncbi:MAG: hypothetical protein ACOZQL_15330 [Myxococcota bacterium]